MLRGYFDPHKFDRYRRESWTRLNLAVQEASREASLELARIDQTINVADMLLTYLIPRGEGSPPPDDKVIDLVVNSREAIASLLFPWRPTPLERKQRQFLAAKKMWEAQWGPMDTPEGKEKIRRMAEEMDRELEYLQELEAKKARKKQEAAAASMRSQPGKKVGKGSKLKR